MRLRALGIHAIHAIAGKGDIRQVFVEAIRPLLVLRHEFGAASAADANSVGGMFPPSAVIRSLSFRRGWGGLGQDRTWVRLNVREGAKVFRFFSIEDGERGFVQDDVVIKEVIVGHWCRFWWCRLRGGQSGWVRGSSEGREEGWLGRKMLVVERVHWETTRVLVTKRHRQGRVYLLVLHIRHYKKFSRSIYIQHS